SLDVAAYFTVKTKMDTRVLKDFTTFPHDRQFELEIRDAETQQSADFRVAVVDRDTDAIPGQDIRAGQPGRAGAHDAHAPRRGPHAREIRPPAALQGFIDDVFLHRADGDRAKTSLQRAG